MVFFFFLFSFFFPPQGVAERGPNGTDSDWRGGVGLLLLHYRGTYSHLNCPFSVLVSGVGCPSGRDLDCAFVVIDLTGWWLILLFLLCQHHMFHPSVLYIYIIYYYEYVSTNSSS